MYLPRTPQRLSSPKKCKKPLNISHVQNATKAKLQTFLDDIFSRLRNDVEEGSSFKVISFIKTSKIDDLQSFNL